ncbi:TAXI family TRAP transporter solute-binding subunit [Devosia nitrariae]|uniref:C4-dicarboxylate ABC transporter substrate-binding protein n=1 Tax=Devosia nitrariae TaxID=2071872 RepID=A0ABQ5W6R5_9HYPH|nr:TAXI family TRAP transporter solute-binding subunit [Devosia nitrariae]GLQ55593.1 C4-dicarboxylate ABC transporter substrate-binding protein [Devosia nitrariae]
MSNKFVKLAAATAAIAALAAPAMAQDSVRLGTSGSGSVFYTLGVGLSQLITEHGGINVSVESVGGSHANVFAMMNDQVDFAIINAMAASDGYFGNPPFPQAVNNCLVAQGQPTLRQVLVRKGAGIETIADLAGKTWITTMPANPDIALISATVAETGGLNQGDWQDVSMAESIEAINGFEGGTIDAVTLPASAGAPNVAQLMDSGTIDFLYMTPENVAAIEPNLPRGLSIFTLPADTYPNQKQPVQVFGMRTILVANCDLPEDIVYRVAQSLFDHVQEFAGYHPTGAEWNVDNTLDRPPVPFHAGTAKYLIEKGRWSAEAQAALEESF